MNSFEWVNINCVQEHLMIYVWIYVSTNGLVAEYVPTKHETRVRFPVSAYKFFLVLLGVSYILEQIVESKYEIEMKYNGNVFFFLLMSGCDKVKIMKYLVCRCRKCYCRRDRNV